MEEVYSQAICRAKKGKAAGPDGVPMELIQIYPTAFAEILFELFTDECRMKCFIKDWDVSISIPNHKKIWLIAVQPNNRPLRPIYILMKIFEMGMTVKMVTKVLDKVEKYRFNEKSMALTPVAMIVSADSL